MRLRVRPHHAFHAGPPGSRDLYYTASITLSESLLGFQRVLLYHLDGRGIKVDCPTGERIIKHGDTFFIKGEGMPKNASTRNRAGDLYIKFDVEMPDLDWVKRQQGQAGPEVCGLFSILRPSSDVTFLAAGYTCCPTWKEGRSGNIRGYHHSCQTERVS